MEKIVKLLAEFFQVYYDYWAKTNKYVTQSDVDKAIGLFVRGKSLQDDNVVAFLMALQEWDMELIEAQLEVTGTHVRLPLSFTTEGYVSHIFSRRQFSVSVDDVPVEVESFCEKPIEKEDVSLYMTLDEFCKLGGYSKSSVYRKEYRERHNLPIKQSGGKGCELIILRSEAEEFLKNRGGK